MLGKILLTLAVIVVALVYLQQRRIAAQAASLAAVKQETPANSQYRLAAWLFLVLMLGAAATFATLRWQDANQEVTVLLHRAAASDAVSYQVRKKDLAQRAFTTTDGVRVTVSDAERMEVIGL